VYLLARKYPNNLNTFLVSNRSITFISGALSIAAAWIWAPALFIASQKAFESGLPGVFWFSIPNALALVLIGIFATKLKSYKPDGFTLPEFIKIRLGKRNHLLFIIIILIVQLYSLTLHLTATNLVLTKFTSYSKEALIILLAMTFYILAVVRGIRSSIFADIVKILFIIVIVLVIMPVVIMKNGGIQTVLHGLNVKSTNIFDPTIFLTFGISVSISLLTAAVIDQQLWQRAFSIKKGNEKKAFILGSIIFFIIPLGLSCFGFLAAAKDLVPKSNQLVGYEIIASSLPFIGVALFVFTIILTMIAAGSSALCAVSSICAVDIYGTYLNKASTEKQRLKVGRISIILILVIATLIAFIPNIQLLYLLLLIGAIRSALLAPTFFAIFKKNLSSQGTFYGMLGGIIIGLPVFVYGSLAKKPLISSAGSLLTLLTSFIIVILFNKLRPEYFDFKSLTRQK
ncbi:MAG: hypothetical protein KJ710_06710, partial [Candidatus Omnitrophica bacterium]|nr:hypothetical protein [Candidatus Omnitrophota bacterium]MBU1923925.1 hypothetical protein [Candidatus Omnitrophota bacterium]